MNVVLLTTQSVQFGSVLIAAYRASGGPPFSSALIVPNRRDLSFPLYAWPLVAAKMLGVDGVLAHLASHGTGMVPARWRGMGLEQSWLTAITGAAARVRTIAAANSPEGRSALEAETPDVLVSIGVPQVLKPETLAIPRLGSINVHHGLLPRYRGHFATFWEVLERRPSYGVTVHVMAPRVDGGLILRQALFAWDEADGFADLMIKKKWAAGRMLAEVLNTIAARPEPLLAPECDGPPVIALPRAYRFPTVADLRKWSWRNRAPDRSSVQQTAGSPLSGHADHI